MTHTEIAIEGLLRWVGTMADILVQGGMTVESARAIYDAAEPTEAWAVSAGADYGEVRAAWVEAWSLFEPPLGMFDRQVHGRSLRSELETDTMIQAYLTEKVPLTLNEVTLDDFTLETLEEDLKRHWPYKLVLRESDRRRGQDILHSPFSPSIVWCAHGVWLGDECLKGRK